MFYGAFNLDKPLSKLHKLYLKKFSEIRHVKRHVKSLPPDPILGMVNLDYGIEGEYFISSVLKEVEPWTPQTNQYYTEEFKQKVLILIYLQKTHMSGLDINVFFHIIKYLAVDQLDFNLSRNIDYLSFTGDEESGVVDQNYPNYSPHTQPGLYCQWIPNDEGTTIEWDQGEKFYYYHKWIEYIVSHFIIPWGYKLNGKVSFYGEDNFDRGIIEIVNNNISWIYN
jgi:hypothetical protein